MMLLERRERHDNEYVMQNDRQARRRPKRSASVPVNVAETAAAMNPIMKRAATTSSGSCFSSKVVSVHITCIPNITTNLCRWGRCMDPDIISQVTLEFI